MSLLLLNNNNKKRKTLQQQVRSPLCENARSTYADAAYNRLYGTINCNLL